MNRTNIDKARKLLLRWIACGERERSYESIRKSCEYIDQTYDLNLKVNAVWMLFQPLLRTGVVEFSGRDCYALCPAVAAERDGLFIYNSILPQKQTNHTPFISIYKTSKPEDVEGMKVYKFNAETVLKQIPSVKEVVDTFPVSIEDLRHVDYYHYRGAKGLTKRVDNGLVRYFCIPELSYQREVPGRVINPDAFSIAYNYSRSLNGLSAGKYNSGNKELIMESFGLPCSIERVLFLESMTLGHTPEEVNRHKVFPSIGQNIIKQLNRILCDTIKYE